MKTIHEVVSALAHQLWQDSIQRGNETDALTNWTQAESRLGLYRPYVRREAYFNWRYRQRFGLSGTAEGDWLEAETKLVSVSSPILRLLRGVPQQAA